MTKPNEKRNRKIQRRGGDFDEAVSPRAIRGEAGYVEPAAQKEDPLIERELAEEQRQRKRREEHFSELRRRTLADRGITEPEGPKRPIGPMPPHLQAKAEKREVGHGDGGIPAGGKRRRGKDIFERWYRNR